MELKQKTLLSVEKDGKVVELYVPTDMPLGLLFDCLMEFKGYCADRMAKAHQQEMEEAESKMSPEGCKEACEAPEAPEAPEAA